MDSFLIDNKLNLVDADNEKENKDKTLLEFLELSNQESTCLFFDKY